LQNILASLNCNFRDKFENYFIIPINPLTSSHKCSTSKDPKYLPANAAILMQFISWCKWWAHLQWNRVEKCIKKSSRVKESLEMRLLKRKQMQKPQQKHWLVG